MGNGYHYPPSPYSYGSLDPPYSDTVGRLSESGERAAPPPYRPPPAELSGSRGSFSSLNSYDSSSYPVNPVLPSVPKPAAQQQQQHRSSTQSRQLPEVPGRGRPEGEEGGSYMAAAPPLPTRRAAPSSEDLYLGRFFSVEINLDQ